MNFIGDIIWISVIALFAIFLGIDTTRSYFEHVTLTHPFIMGFFKFFILATMGELLAIRIAQKEWKVRGIRLYQRALIWGILGFILTIVFPIYSFGVDGLLKVKLLMVPDTTYSFVFVAFYKSVIMNLLFAFPMMSMHRITDTLIDQGCLFSKWPFIQVWNEVNWENMWKKVAPTIVWFWIPAHTITFCLPANYRILMASALGICLGLILVFIKKRSQN